MTAVATPHVGATQLRARLRRGCVQRATRTSTRTRRPSRLIARASEGAPADDAAEEEEEEEEEVGIDDLVELEIGGVSVSPRGFVALLVPKGSAGSIPRAPNPVEELRRAEPRVPLGSLRTAQTLPLLISNRPEDREGAASEWAQAMLQLTQDPPIDMGIQLPYGALDELTGAEGSILGAVFLGEARWDETGTRYVFESTLLAGKDLDQSTYDLRGGEEEAWRALALALRYAPYGCRLFATRKALAAVDARAFGGAAEETRRIRWGRAVVSESSRRVPDAADDEGGARDRGGGEEAVPPGPFHGGERRRRERGRGGRRVRGRRRRRRNLSVMTTSKTPNVFVDS